MIAIHGDADRHVPFRGGYPTVGVNRAWSHRAVPDVIQDWRSIDRCAAPHVTRAGLVTTDEAMCPDGRAVTLVVIAHAGHQWPGSRVLAPGVAQMLQLDPPSAALDATRTLWEFFDRHTTMPP